MAAVAAGRWEAAVRSWAAVPEADDEADQAEAGRRAGNPSARCGAPYLAGTNGKARFKRERVLATALGGI